MIKLLSMLAVSLALTMALPIVEAQANNTRGALALEREGDRFGISHSFRSRQEARNRAMRECGRNCSVVLEFNACAAYAADESRRGSAFGWAEHRSANAAEDRALRECRKQGGRRCGVRASACND
jgi:hypothetical protein